MENIPGSWENIQSVLRNTRCKQNKKLCLQYIQIHVVTWLAVIDLHESSLSLCKTFYRKAQLQWQAGHEGLRETTRVLPQYFK